MGSNKSVSSPPTPEGARTRRTWAFGVLGIFGAFFAVLGFIGCGGNGTAPNAVREHIFQDEYPIRIVATTGMVADLVRQVGGSHVSVITLMGAGTDPHQYKVNPGDVSQMNAADLIFYSGLHLEGKMTDLFVRLARKKPTFAVTEKIDEQQVLEDEQGAHDPHLWFDVSLWSQAVGVIADELARFDAVHADDYNKNAGKLRAELQSLHEETKSRLATIPKERRVLVTAHDAFHYFGRAYDMEVRGIQGISTEDEASVKHLNELVEFLTQRRIKAVFVESSVSDRNIRSLVEGCKARGHQIIIGGELFSDAMGETGTPGGSYVGMIRHNVDTIVRALQ